MGYMKRFAGSAAPGGVSPYASFRQTGSKGGPNKPFSIAVTGVVELDKVLEEMASDVGAKSINAAMRKACRAAVKEIVLPEVKARVPHDWGFLESQIVVRAGKRSRTRISYWVGFPDPLFEGDTHYGGYIEFGTAPRTKKKSGASTGYVEMDSFLRAALYPNANKIIAQVRQAMGAWVNEMNAIG